MNTNDTKVPTFRLVYSSLQRIIIPLKTVLYWYVYAMAVATLHGVHLIRKTVCVCVCVCVCVSQDVSGRLVGLAWNDWSPDVRTAAAQALGQTGHGKVCLLHLHLLLLLLPFFLPLNLLLLLLAGP